MNEGLDKLGLSPLNYTSVSERDILGYGRRKIQQVQSSINEDSSHLLVYNIDEGIMPSTPQLPCDKCRNMDEMLDTLKDKIKIWLHGERIKKIAFHLPFRNMILCQNCH